MNGEGSCRVGEKKQTNYRNPKYPPSNVITAPFIREPTTQGPDHASWQRKCQCDIRRLHQAQLVFLHVVFWQPQGQRHESAEHGVIGKTVSPHSLIPQRHELVDKPRQISLSSTLLQQRIGIGEQPKKDSHHQHYYRVNFRYCAPAKGHYYQRSN